jgi:hypothetical protein
MEKITKLTAEQESRLVEFTEEWRQIGLSCEPADFAAGDEAIRGFYKRIGKPEPIILHFSSPAMCEIAVNFVFGMLKDEPSQLRSQLYSQLRSQLYSQLYSQLDSQLYSQLDSQLRSQLDSQLYSQLGSQLYSQLGSQLGELKSYFLYNRWGAGHWCAWEAFYLFGHEIGVKYQAEDIALLLEWGRISKSIGWWAPWDGICFVSDRPRKVSFDEQRLLHSETGKAVEYSDGWGVSSWHGTRVPDHWLADRANLDPNEVIKADNVEQRAAGAAIVGWSKMLSVLNAKVVDDSGNDDIGQLIELTLPGLPEPGLFLKAKCPRNGIIVEGVPRISDIDGLAIDTAIAAQAWRVGDPQSEYAHPPRRT